MQPERHEIRALEPGSLVCCRPISSPSTPRSRLDRAVPAPATRPLNRVEDSPHPVLQQVRDVADGVAMGEQVPAPGPVPVVVEPGPENQIRGDAQEDATSPSAKFSCVHEWVAWSTHMMTNQVKNPQWLLLLPPSSSPSLGSRFSHAYLVCQVRRRTSISFSFW